MTLLDEYQALPGEPEPFRKAPKRLGDILDYQESQLVRREAIIRLLVKALRHATTSVEVLAPLAKPATHEYLDQAREDRALLTAVERDFPEGV